MNDVAVDNDSIHNSLWPSSRNQKLPNRPAFGAIIELELPPEPIVGFINFWPTDDQNQRAFIDNRNLSIAGAGTAAQIDAEIIRVGHLSIVARRDFWWRNGRIWCRYRRKGRNWTGRRQW